MLFFTLNLMAADDLFELGGSGGDLEGEEGFRLREENIINDLTDKQGIVLATGGGSVVSKNVRNRLSARGIVVYLQTTIDKLFDTINANTLRNWFTDPIFVS